MLKLNNKSVYLASPIVKLAAGIILIAAMKTASSILLPLLLALFISIICAQPIFWLVKRKWPSGLAILVVLSGLALALLLIAGIIANSLTQFTSDIPRYQESLNKLIYSLGEKFSFISEDLSIDKIFASIDTSKVLSFSSNLIGQLGNLMSDSFLIMLVTIFILSEMHLVVLKAELLEKEYGESFDYLNEVGRKIRHYLSLKTVISLITGALVTISLWILDVNYAILWGVIAFVLNYIPTIGSFIAAIPAVLLALVDNGVSTFVWTGVIYVVINTVMGNVIEPKLMGRGLGLSTLVVFLSLIFWGYIFGTIGMFLSVPITISIKIMLHRKERTRWMSLLLSSEPDVKKMLKDE